MASSWFFTAYLDDGVVEIRARLESPGGIIGDLCQELRPGQHIANLTYDELAAAGAGQLKTGRDGVTRIRKPRRQRIARSARR
jgi:hypothetical protein